MTRRAELLPRKGSVRFWFAVAILSPVAFWLWLKDQWTEQDRRHVR